MTANNPVKATDSNIISLKNLGWCDTAGYYFDPLTDQVYSSIAPKHSVNNLFPLTAEVSNNGSKSFKLRGIRFSVEQIHDDLSNNADTKLRAAYKKIMASKGKSTEPVTNSSEKWVKVTDWRTLKVGDIIKTDDPDFNRSQSYTITYVEPPEFSGKCAIKVAVPQPQTQVEWVDIRNQLYQAESLKSSKGWVIMRMASQGTLYQYDISDGVKIYHSESEADAKLKHLCDESPNTMFVKLEIKNFAITKTNPEFHLT
jgi:hypothetical protein